MDETVATERFSLLRRIAFVGTYIPRRCGIGTFTNDVLEAVATAHPGAETLAVALNDRPEGYRYPNRVKFEINQNRVADYRLAADYLNAARVDVVSLQHEYGIFGGDTGQHVLKLIKQLNMPVVTTLHTILREPNDRQRAILLEVADRSDRIVVMAHKAVEFLREIYRVPDEKVVYIPHGIPEVPFIDPNFYKDHFGVEGKKVILTFGLLGPGKGIENMIDALPMIVKKHPDVVYIVLGATHPHVQATFGEDYRGYLERRAAQLGVAENVVFHNRFVELKELCEFLGAADVYVTPYLSEAQIVSGTLAYALGAGNAVVSTPYWYAQELLGDGRGRLVPFKDANSLSATISQLFDKETERHAIRKAGYVYTRDFIWPKVAESYLEVFVQCENERREQPHPRSVSPLPVSSRPELPEIKLDHLIGLTDDTSVLRHAKGEVPDLEHGYSTDTTARALIAVLRARDLVPSGTGCSRMIGRYLAFLNFAFDRKNGRFRNVLTYDRRWVEEGDLEDSHGRAVWALGELVSRAERRGHAMLASQLFHRALPEVLEFKNPRAWALSLIGIHAYLRRFGGDTEVKRARAELSKKLYTVYQSRADSDWCWPENTLTFENGHLPHALLLCGQWMFKHEMRELALKSLQWLVDVQTSSEGHYSPVGTDGWYERGQTKARFLQQPVEAHAMIDACLEAYRMTHDQKWIDSAYRMLNWFFGQNDLHTPLYDPSTGGCFDGLHSRGVNENQGAEATTAWLLSLAAMYEQTLELDTLPEPPDPDVNPIDEVDKNKESIVVIRPEKKGLAETNVN